MVYEDLAAILLPITGFMLKKGLNKLVIVMD